MNQKMRSRGAVKPGFFDNTRHQREDAGKNPVSLLCAQILNTKIRSPLTIIKHLARSPLTITKYLVIGNCLWGWAKHSGNRWLVGNQKLSPECFAPTGLCELLAFDRAPIIFKYDPIDRTQPTIVGAKHLGDNT